jgi:hypothetical protein
MTATTRQAESFVAQKPSMAGNHLGTENRRLTKI